MDEREVQEDLKRFFDKDEFVKRTGAQIQEISENRVVVRAKILPSHLNANGCVQGGMLYTVADFAFAVLGNYLHPSTVTQSGHIQYMRPAFTDEITAIATETERAGHTTVSEVTVKNAEGKTVCICHFTGFVKDTKRE